ncbi:MAG TPA: hypothetical protein VFS11_04505 [Gemmatimonadales bacterium]|nr:hypothetical protein [Gemmatimonadales bacterium]
MMRRAECFGIAVALAVGLVAAGCHHRNGNEAEQRGRQADPEMADTLEGTVQVGGVQAFPKVTLLGDSGARSATLEGPATLARVAGLRIAVYGRQQDDKFVVKQFRVVSANGVPATDGRLVAEGEGLALETADGARHPLGRPSPGLRQYVGQRVWVAGSLDREPVSYGVIE